MVISEKSGRRWELGDALIGFGESFVRVARVDSRSVVLARTESEYLLPRKSVKFFFDLTARKTLKTIEFDPSVRVIRPDHL